MRIIGIVILFFSLCNIGYAQNLKIPSFEANATHDDSLECSTVFNVLNKYDFSISELYHAGWVSGKRNGNTYYIIAYKDGKWFRFNLFQPYKFKNNHFEYFKPKCNFLKVNDSICKIIYDKMIEVKLLSMTEDSLNYRGKIINGKIEERNVSDGSTCSILIISQGLFRVTWCNNPDDYYKWNPSIVQRKKFIDFRDLFEKVWKEQ